MAQSEDTSSQPIDVPEARARAIPEAAVARLAVYLRVLTGLAEQGSSTISSEELAGAAGVNSAKLRKDLSYIGSYGTRGVGYEVDVLIGQIERTLGLTRKHSVAVAGIGNLGHALANYGGFPGRGFPVVALFDVDQDLMGVPVGGLPVDHVDDIERVCSQRSVTVGVIATPPEAAQDVCDRLVAGGVHSILNFAPVVLRVPNHVEVRKVDLAVEMQILAFHMAKNGQIMASPENRAPEEDSENSTNSKTASETGDEGDHAEAARTTVQSGRPVSHSGAGLPPLSGAVEDTGTQARQLRDDEGRTNQAGRSPLNGMVVRP